MAMSTFGKKVLRYSAFRKAAIVNNPTMAQLAQGAGVLFGTAVYPTRYAAQDYKAHSFGESAIVTTESELNWSVVEGTQGVFDFSLADATVAAAVAAGVQVRGHMIIDATGTSPGYTQTVVGAVAAGNMIDAHIDALMAHFPGLHSWDVVNEAIKPSSFGGTITTGGFSGMWNNHWIATMTVDPATGYIAHALKRVRLQDPTTKLVLNFDRVETGTADDINNRAQILAYVTALLNAGTPLDAIGMEAHLGSNYLTSQRMDLLLTWLDQLHALGLDVYITECDIDDATLGNTNAARDTQSAAIMSAFAAPVVNHPAVKVFEVWEIDDRSSWLQRGFSTQRADHQSLRPTLLDGAFRIKPIYTALANAFIAATPAGPPPPNPSLPTLVFNDGSGPVTLTAGTPTLANWTPDGDEPGSTSVRIGTGVTDKVIFRRDHYASFIIEHMRMTDATTLMRLKFWLESGGTVTINTQDLANRVYNAILRPGTKPVIQYDRVTLDLTMSVQVKNLADQVLICEYEV